jgi:hypothetical protein
MWWLDGAIVFRREYCPALGFFEDVEIIVKVGRSYLVTPDCKFVIC